MEFLFEMFGSLLSALLAMLMQPFYYIGLLLVILQYRRQIQLERKLFRTKLHSLLDQSGRVLLYGWAGGLLASVLMAGIGATVQPAAIVMIWVVSLLLVMLRVRFLCLAYAVGLLGALHAVFRYFPALSEAGWLQWLALPLLQLNIPSLLALVAILHALEAILLLQHGSRTASPMFYEGKRGKIVGGFHLQGFWPVPLFLLVPLEGGSTVALPWTPLIGGDMWAAGWSFVALPAVVGFAERTMSRLPQQAARWNGRLLLVYAGTVLLLAVGATVLPVLTIGAALLTIVFHEAVIWYSRWNDVQRTAVYVHDERGLKILAVVPGSPAAELGLVSGEIIHKVNGLVVRTKEQLYYAIQQNPAFCKLEIYNLEGYLKFLHKAVYAGEHHQLGIILAPDQSAEYYAVDRPESVFSFFAAKWAGVKKKTRSV